jgi:hypothetical protein
MAMTNTEKQAAYRERMYAAGFKQTRVWVPRETKEKATKMGRQAFLKKLDQLTSGWTKNRLSNLFNVLVPIIQAYKRR